VSSSFENNKKVMGVDASTMSMAYCVMEDQEVLAYGEIFFHGDSVFERAVDASKKIKALKDEFNYDMIAIESAIIVNSAVVGIKMAYVFGAIVAELCRNGEPIVEVKPLAWQSYIGNKAWNAAQKADLKKANPKKSVSWLKNEMRKQRKQATIDYFNTKYGTKIQSDNVADAFGVAYYVSGVK
jgi:Holliday junction resolvasome RuvABC endonuclease subunit